MARTRVDVPAPTTDEAHGSDDPRLDSQGVGSPPDNGANPSHEPGDRYVVVDERARGGIGRIVTAQDRILERTVAIKELMSQHPRAEARFLREAKITSRLEHPSIVPVHDAGRWPDSGRPFYSMKLVSGRSLKDAVEAARTLRDRLALLPNAIAVTEAIAYAHTQGVIHRDIKPANVIIGSFGETIVIDWGLAKDLNIPSSDEETGDQTDAGDKEAAEPERAAPGHLTADAPTADTLLELYASLANSDEEVTIDGAVLGTPAFMPPEQARGQAVDERADVYALGAMLYYTLSGRTPYQGRNHATVLAGVLNKAPPPLRTIAPQTPPDLAAIVDKAMARERDDRYPSARELTADLRRFQTGQLVGAHDYSRVQLLVRWARRHRGVALATALFLIAATVVAGWFLVREQNLRHAAEQARDRAQLQRARADQSTRALLEEKGRDELAAGRPHRAAVYLSDAYRRDPNSRALRWLVSEAVQPLRSHQRSWRAHSGKVVSANYSPEGAWLVTASDDRTVKVWNAQTAELHRTWYHDAPLYSATFSDDGAKVVSASEDQTLRLWDVRADKLLRVIADPDPIAVVFAPGGDFVVVGDRKGWLRVYEVATGSRVFETQAHNDLITALTFSPDGKWLASCGWDGKAILWDWTTRTAARVFNDHTVQRLSDVSFSADGRWFVTAEALGTLHIRRVDNGEKVRSLWRSERDEAARWPVIQLSRDGDTITTVGQDGRVQVWHVASGALLFSVDVQPRGTLFHPAVLRGGERVATGTVEGYVRQWNIREGASYRVLAGTRHDRSDIFGAVFTRDGRRAVAGATGRHLSIWDTATTAMLSHWYTPTTTASVAVGAGGERVATVSREVTSEGPSALLWDARTGAQVAPLVGHQDLVYNLAASADGAWIASASGDRTVRIWDARTGAPSQPVIRGDEPFSAVAFGPFGQRIATGGVQGELALWDRTTGKPLWRIHTSTSTIQDVEFSHDGTQLATAGRDDHASNVWSAKDGAHLLSLRGHDGSVMRASFSPDGAVIATVSVDRTARLWDVSTGALLRVIHGPKYTAEFSPDGRSLLTTGSMEYAVLWDIDLDERSPEDIVAYVQERSPWRLVKGRLVLVESSAYP